MAITYPLDFPSILESGIASFRLGLNNAVAATRSPFTLSEQVVSYSGQAWEGEVTLVDMPREYAEEFNAFLLELQGRKGTFLLGDPNAKTARGALGGTPLVNGASQTGNTLDIDGLSLNITNWGRKGDTFSIGTGTNTRLHKLTQDCDSNGSGETTIQFMPNLRESPADNAALDFTDAKGHFRLAENYIPFEIDNESIYSMRFKIVEAL